MFSKSTTSEVMSDTDVRQKNFLIDELKLGNGLGPGMIWFSNVP